MDFNRRTFIQVAAGGTAGILFTPVIWKTLDDISIWSQNWGWIPKLNRGNVAEKATYSKMCPAGCAAKVKSVKEFPYATVGNEANTITKGGLCPLCLSGVQMAYSPSRVRTPLLKTAENQYKEISWDEAMSIMVEKIGAVRKKKNAFGVISGDITSSTNEVLSALCRSLNSNAYYLMPSDARTELFVWNSFLGGSGQPAYDFADVDFGLFLGADVFESWGAAVAAKEARALTPDATYMYAGSVQTRTASIGDWLPVQNDKLTAFALGLAFHILRAGKRSGTSDFAQFRTFIQEKYTPIAVEREIGIGEKEMEAIAKRLLAAKKPLVVAGSSFSQGGTSTAFVASVVLNRLLETAAFGVIPEAPTVVKNAMKRSELAAQDIMQPIIQGTNFPEVIITYEANPFYGLPALRNAVEVFQHSFVISMSTYLDETAEKADLILPANHPYERHDDSYAPFGTGLVNYNIVTPTMNSGIDAKTPGDIVLSLAKSLNVDLVFANMQEIVEAKTKALGATSSELMQGLAFTKPANKVPTKTILGALLLKTATIKENGKKGKYSLAPQFLLNIGTVSLATPPLNLITIRDTELSYNDMFVAMCSTTAKELSVMQGDKVRVSSKVGEIVAKVNIAESVMPGVITAPIGFGRTAWDHFTKGKGANLFNVIEVVTESGTNMNVWEYPAVNIAKV